MTQGPVIRPVLPEEMTRFTGIHVQAWNMDPAGFNPSSEELEDSRVLAVDGELVACLFMLRREAWIGSDRVPQVGLGGVATPPEHRRQGHCRTLLRAVLAEARERGDLLSLLWPFSHAFYRKHGWEVGGGELTVAVPPGTLPRHTAAGWSIRPVDPGSEADLAALDSVYTRWAQAYNGCLVRRAQDWKRVLVRKNERRFGYLFRSSGGEPVAYVVYAFKDLGNLERDLQVKEHAALTGPAHAALLGFLRDHDSQTRKVEFKLPRDAWLFHSSPDQLRAGYRDAFMLRLVDVAGALAARTYPEAGEMELAWRVRDALCPWNEGTFRVTCAGPHCAVERADAIPPDLDCDISTLSGIYAGHMPPRVAHGLGRLSVAGQVEARLSWLERAFGCRPGYLLDFF